MPKVRNKTFDSNNPSYNACVGNNGGATDRTYASGYKDSVEILLNAVLDGGCILDRLVYPIMYNARHYVELSLKSTLESLRLIYKSRRCRFEASGMKGHSLKILMTEVKRLSSIDPVYQEVVTELEKYVSDYYEIDDSAETFRFSKSHDGKKHLEDRDCIGLIGFAENFAKMSELLEWLDTINVLLLDYEAQRNVD